MIQARLYRRGFTLIEILISVTLSAILMTGILIFVSGSLSSQTASRDRIADRTGESKFQEHFNHVLAHSSETYASGVLMTPWYGTGMLLATDTVSPMTFIGSMTATGYCDAYSGSASATGTIERLFIRHLTGTRIRNDAPYVISSEDSSVFSWSERLIGTLYPGNTLAPNGLATELHGPSAVIRHGSSLFIADTMNRRILSYDLVTKQTSLLLSANDGLGYPTDLAFSGETLLIADSEHGAIRSIEDSTQDGSIAELSFRVAKPFSANEIRFVFSGIPAITTPTTASDFTFSGVTSSMGDSVLTGATLRYVLSGSVATFVPGSNYGIRIRNTSPLPVTPGGYGITALFYQWGSIVYTELFSHFTRGDGSIASMTGNIVRTISGGLLLPHDLTSTGTWDTGINITTLLTWSGTIAQYTSGPIRDLRLSRQWNILTIRYEEYLRYDCIDGKHSVRERIRKIRLKK